MSRTYDWHIFKYDVDEPGLTDIWFSFCDMLKKSDIHYKAIHQNCEHFTPCVRVLVKSRLREKVRRKFAGKDVLGHKFLSYDIETIQGLPYKIWYYCELCGWPKDECSDSD